MATRKRTRAQAAFPEKYTAAKRRRSSYQVARLIQGPVPMLQRAPSYGMVPLSTRGYTPNLVEKKVFDRDSTLYQVNSTGSFTLLCAPIPGSDMTNRIGRKILIKSVYVRGFVGHERAMNLAAIDASGQLPRMILFIDYQPNGAAPAVTDILKETGPVSQLNLNYRDRFKILCDKQWVVDPFMYSAVATQSYASAANTLKPVKVYKKLNLTTVFNAGTAGTIADIASGALYMFWIGGAVAGTQDINASICTRVRYVDV